MKPVAVGDTVKVNAQNVKRGITGGRVVEFRGTVYRMALVESPDGQTDWFHHTVLEVQP